MFFYYSRYFLGASQQLLLAFFYFVGCESKATTDQVVLKLVYDTIDITYKN